MAFAYQTEHSGYSYDDYGREYFDKTVVDRKAVFLGTVKGTDLFLFQQRGEVPEKVYSDLLRKNRRFETIPLGKYELDGMLLAISESRHKDCLNIDWQRFKNGVPYGFEVNSEHPAYCSGHSAYFYPGMTKEEGEKYAAEQEGIRMDPYDDQYYVSTVTPYGVMIAHEEPYDD